MPGIVPGMWGVPYNWQVLWAEIRDTVFCKKKRETEGQFCVKGELGPRSYLDYEKVTLPREPQENSLLQVDDGHPSPGAKGSSI